MIAEALLSLIVSLFGLVIIGALYLLPAIVAQYGEHKHAAAIWTLNILLGWTLPGWVIALVWATMDQTRPPRRSPSPPQEKTLEEMLAEEPGGRCAQISPLARSTGRGAASVRPAQKNLLKAL